METNFSINPSEKEDNICELTLTKKCHVLFEPILKALEVEILQGEKIELQWGMIRYRFLVPPEKEHIIKEVLFNIISTGSKN